MSPELDDSEVLQKRRSDKDTYRAEKFARLFDGGDLADYGGDRSSADLGLVNLLAYYTQDPVQLDRLFRRSALMRGKWDERHRGDGANYGEMTIEKALVGRKPKDCWRGTEKDPEPSEAVNEGGIGERSLVGRAIAEGVEPPEMLVDGLIYRGGIHSWIAEGETGKSMLALWVSILVMGRGENVLYLDQEGAIGMVAERLEAMGADPEMLDRRFHYYQSPDVTLAQGPFTDLLEKARGAKAALVVFDSWADFLALDGLDENDSMDVTRWVTGVVYPLRDLRAACLLLDHSNKEGKGKGGRGSTAKRNKMDASHKLQKAEDFHRSKVGKVRFVVDKDRLGAMDRTAAFRLGGDGTGKIVCRREGSVGFVVDDLATNQKKAYLALGKGGLRTSEWEKKTGLGGSSFYKARKALVEEQGLVRQDDDGLYYPTSESVRVGRGKMTRSSPYAVAPPRTPPPGGGPLQALHPHSTLHGGVPPDIPDSPRGASGRGAGVCPIATRTRRSTRTPLSGVERSRASLHHPGGAGRAPGVERGGWCRGGCIESKQGLQRGASIP
jgi:hypothetical protein